MPQFCINTRAIRNRQSSCASATSSASSRLPAPPMPYNRNLSEPRVTVVVPTSAGDERLGACLQVTVIRGLLTQGILGVPAAAYWPGLSKLAPAVTPVVVIQRLRRAVERSRPAPSAR